LEHWLDVDYQLESIPKHIEDSTHFLILVSQLAALEDPIPKIREMCLEFGCENINKPDIFGKTFLHHILSGLKIIFQSLCICIS